jgi:ABC-2 type transport system ATP-binding protein
VNSGAAIVVDRLRVVRGGHVAVADLSLAIAAGRVSGLLGPSGCGKSTLMRAIVGVQRVAVGAVTVLGEPAGSPSLRDRVGYMTQAPSVYGDLTVRENLRFFARVLNAPEARIDAALATVDLERHAGQVVGTLSGGEVARTSLAAALLGDPDVLVLDEPTVGLDPVLRRDLWTTFRRLAAEGRALLVSSHVMDEAAQCDDLLLMRAGRLLAAGRREDLLRAAGTHDLEVAFLALIERDERQAVPA